MDNQNDLDRTEQTSREGWRPDPTQRDLPSPLLSGEGMRTANSFNPSASASGTPPSPQVAPQASDEDLLGTTYVGRYLLESIIGSGGMGVIFKGRQVFLDRVVAVKMLKSNLGGESARLRFHQEAKAASQLNHPGIVTISDFGVDELDRPYMVMEYVEGCTLADLLREKTALTVEDALPIFLEICDALSAAHQKGVVHRDLKPSNIMLVADSENKIHIKLLDFGIAKLLDLQDQTLQSLTKTGEALGTPLYMSPEQILGERVTYRSDLYSLGCVFYMCLTGVPPFVGQNKLATMEKHCTAKPLAMKLVSRGRSFPEGIEALIMRLLAKKPMDRFDSVDQFRNALINEAVLSETLLNPPSAINNAGGLPLLMEAAQDGGAGGLFGSGAESQSRHDLSLPVPANRRNEGKLGEHKDRKFAVKATSLAVGGSLIALTIVCTVASLVGLVPLTSGSHEKKQKAQVEQPELKELQVHEVPQEANLTIERAIRSRTQDSSLSLRDQRGVNAESIRKLRGLKLLTVLDLGGTHITDAIVKLVSELPLSELALDNDFGITDASVADLAKMPKLKVLSLANTGIGDYSLRHLAKSHSLIALNLTGNRRITSNGVENLASGAKQLQYLYVSNCDLSDSAANSFLKLPELVALDVSINKKISDRTLETLAKKEKGIRILSVAQDDIHESGIHQLRNFKDLAILDLSYLIISPQSLKEIGKLTKLKRLYLKESNLTVDDIQKLRNALPGARVEAGLTLATDTDR